MMLRYNLVLNTKLICLHKIGVHKFINMASSTFNGNDEQALFKIPKHFLEYTLVHSGNVNTSEFYRSSNFAVVVLKCCI